ncbi:transposase [Spirillospora sp. NPDC048819]|uniref:transposase n=1 Tax=Spirillospora sp. NPDC048819 TaxID=3155268 RepID=UPI0033F70F78
MAKSCSSTAPPRPAPRCERSMHGPFSPALLAFSIGHSRPAPTPATPPRSEPDVLRSVLKTRAEALMSAEADAVCGAGYGRRFDARVSCRKGYRQRNPRRHRRAGHLQLDRGPTSPGGRRNVAAGPSRP